jgi:hypothetical protein
VADEACQRLRKILGVGPLVSTATVAAIGNGEAFRKGRECAAWLGLVPRQHSTGGRARLFGISKRGNIYLRRMFIHGARAVLLRVTYDTAGLGQWVHQLQQRTALNKGIVAIANRLARIAWAVLFKGEEFDTQPSAHAPENGGGRDAALAKRCALPTFPPPRRRRNESHRGPLRREEDERTVKRRAGKPEFRNGSW